VPIRRRRAHHLLLLLLLLGVPQLPPTVGQVSPEMHGEVTGTFKTQIDWLPLNTGSVRPTQGRTVMLAQVAC